MGSRMYRGIADSMALWQPAIVPQNPHKSGIFLGFENTTGRNAFLWPYADNKGGFFRVSGMRGFGKSTALKSLSMRMGCMQGYDVFGNPEELRVQVSSRKSAEGFSEYEKMLKAQGATSINMADPRGINVFGLFKHPNDIRVLAVDIANYEVNQRLSPAARIAIFVGVEKMFTLRQYVHPASLEYIVRSLNIDDFASFYMKGVDAIMGQQMIGSAVPGTDLIVTPQEILISAETIRDQHYFAHHHLSAAREAADALFAFLEGYGGIFRGDNDLYDVLRQPVVGLDWEILDNNYPGASEVIEAALMRAEASAITYARMNTGGVDLTKIVPHAISRDEEGDPSNKLIHMQAKATKVNKLRAYMQVMFEAFQYDIQSTMVGEPDSPLRKAAMEVEFGVTGRIFYRQPDNDEVLHQIAMTGLPQSYVDLLPRLEVGQAVLHLNDKLPMIFYHHLLPAERGLIGTRQAYEMMNQVNTNRKVAQLASLSRQQTPLVVGTGQSEFG